jgi:hypothetical protein
MLSPSRGVLCVCLGIAALSSAARDRGFIEIGRASEGLFYWHGHRLEPPYVASVGYRLDPDTVWTGVFINGFSLEPLRELVSVSEPSARAAVTLDSAMTRAIRAAQKRKGEPGGYVRILAEELRAHAEAVDSVIVTSDMQLLVYWRGVSKAMDLTVGDSNGLDSDLSRPPRVRPSAEHILRTLQKGGAVIVSKGILYLPDGTQILAKIDSLRAGHAPLLPSVNGTMREELRHPEPLDSLRARQGD